MPEKSSQKQILTRQKLLRNRKFLSRVSTIRTKYAIPEQGISADKNVGKWNRSVVRVFLKKSGGFTFSQDLDALLHDFDLPLSFRIPVFNFVLLNEFSAPPPLVINLKRNKQTRQLECAIEIFGDTTLRDIKAAWSQIMECQKGENMFGMPLPSFPKGQRAIRNLERDARIRILREAGLSLKEISKRIGEEFGLPNVPYSEISKIIVRNKRIVREQK